ncbi:MAG TPA: hypothetical protein VGP90_07095, partial [Acidimicrobiia bacterium]|nr:hypothetical protein [Acidimicrobiia bacterium]
MLQRTRVSRPLLLAAALSLAILAPLATVAPAGAGTATLVEDLQPGRPDAPSTAFPDPPVLAALPGGRIVFTVEEQLWGSDGTAAGTGVLLDVSTGSGRAPGLLGVVDRFALVRGGERLWSTDGTPDGTVALAEVAENASLSLAATAKLLVFELCGPTGCNLWRSDGTAPGTAVLRAGLAAGDLTAVGDKVFFVSSVPGSQALWRTDGTPAGTFVVHNFAGAHTSPIEDGPARLTAVGNRLFFVAADDVFHGTELWVSDGTLAGTRAASDFATANPTIGFLKGFGNTVYFLADDVFHGRELWQSDGTASGTRAVTDFADPNPFDDAQGELFTPDQLAKVGGHLLFATNRDRTLWVSDGTPATTSRFDACAGSCGWIFSLVPAGDRVLFADRSAALWSTDGTIGGTRKLKLGVEALVSVLGRGYFATADPGATTRTVWQTDGTAAGTRPLGDVAFVDQAFAPVVAGGRTFFPAGDAGRTFQVWATDGTAPALPLTTFGHAGSSSFPERLTAFAGGVLFSASTARGTTWWSGGTAATTTPLPGRADGFTVIGDLAYFRSDSGLWRTDGTPAGTLRLPLPAGVDRPVAVAPLAGKPLIAAVAGRGQLSFLTSDGTPAGTVKLFDAPEAVSVFD